jgi:DNA/RNA endonuclease YhcR with UshA esterase domain
MLSERAIIKYSVIAILIGLLGIYVTIQLMEPISVPLQGVNDAMVGNVIKTQGHVKSSYISNTSTLFVTMEENGSEIEAIKFNTRNSTLESGDLVVVSGEVSKYKGKIEITARTLEKVIK